MCLCLLSSCQMMKRSAGLEAFLSHAHTHTHRHAHRPAGPCDSSFVNAARSFAASTPLLVDVPPAHGVTIWRPCLKTGSSPNQTTLMLCDVSKPLRLQETTQGRKVAPHLLQRNYSYSSNDVLTQHTFWHRSKFI